MSSRLFIVMRDDLPEMRGGFLLPQCAHAASAFQSRWKDADQSHPDRRHAQVWANSTPQGFGTKIVMSGSMQKITALVRASTHIGLFADIIHDPSFPREVGMDREYVPRDTCGYVFIPNVGANPLRARLEDFPLHNG